MHGSKHFELITFHTTTSKSTAKNAKLEPYKLGHQAHVSKIKEAVVIADPTHPKSTQNTMKTLCVCFVIF